MAGRGGHKRAESQEHIQECPWLQPSVPKASSSRTETLLSPSGLGGASSRVRGLISSRENSGALLNNGSSCSGDESSPSSVLEGTLKYKGVRVRVKSSHTGISWKPAAGTMAWCLELAALKTKVPYDEVLGSWFTTNQVSCSCICRKEHAVVVAALARQRGNASEWRVKEHRLVASSLEQAKEWVAAIGSALQLCYDRPRNLLVFINPYSGSRRARQVWALEAAPVFLKAGIKCTVIETLAMDHAYTTLATMKADELAMYQGVVAVGGDGVFQECVRGMMAQRGRGAKNSAVATRMRLGHIPGGSTDAVAYTLHGTRSAQAAALHIALGDRLALDVAKVDCVPSQTLPPCSTLDPNQHQQQQQGGTLLPPQAPGMLPPHTLGLHHPQGSAQHAQHGGPPSFAMQPPRSNLHLSSSSASSSRNGAAAGAANVSQQYLQGGGGSVSSGGVGSNAGMMGNGGQQGGGGGNGGGGGSMAAGLLSGAGQGGGGNGGGSAPGSRLHLQTVMSGQELMRGGSSGNLASLYPSGGHAGGAGNGSGGGGGAGGHLHTSSLSSCGAGTEASSSTALSGVGGALSGYPPRPMGGGEGLAHGKDGGGGGGGGGKQQEEGGKGGEGGEGQGGAGAAGAVGMPPPGVSSRYFVCQAAYGFLGDVMHFSEGLRCLGPSRYDVSGVVQFLRLRSYPLQIAYRPAGHRHSDSSLVGINSVLALGAAALQAGGGGGGGGGQQQGNGSTMQQQGSLGGAGAGVGGASSIMGGNNAPSSGHSQQHPAGGGGPTLGAVSVSRAASSPVPHTVASVLDAAAGVGNGGGGGGGGGMGTGGAAGGGEGLGGALDGEREASMHKVCSYPCEVCRLAGINLARASQEEELDWIFPYSAHHHYHPPAPISASSNNHLPTANTAGSSPSGTSPKRLHHAASMPPALTLNPNDDSSALFSPSSTSNHPNYPTATASTAGNVALSPAALFNHLSNHLSNHNHHGGQGCSSTALLAGNNHSSSSSAISTTLLSPAPNAQPPPNTLPVSHLPSDGPTSSSAAAHHASHYAAGSSGALGAAGASGSSHPGAGGAGSKAGGLVAPPGWVVLEGEFISIMAVVTPCRSDKSKAGIVPHAHLSDGRISLVLVSKCGHLDYLRFLLRLSGKGLVDRCLPFVRVIPISAAYVRPAPTGAPESCWNVDGELLPSNAVRLRVQRGLVDVFARGVELEVPVVH